MLYDPRMLRACRDVRNVERNCICEDRGGAKEVSVPREIPGQSRSAMRQAGVQSVSLNELDPLYFSNKIERNPNDVERGSRSQESVDS